MNVFFEGSLRFLKIDLCNFINEKIYKMEIIIDKF